MNVYDLYEYCKELIIDGKGDYSLYIGQDHITLSYPIEKNDITEEITFNADK